MNTQEIQNKLADFIAKEILKQPKRVIQEQDVLISNGMIDSFHLVDIALFVEQAFGVKIEDTELNADTFDTLGELTALIQQRLA
jgi:acyl carrier protein